MYLRCTDGGDTVEILLGPGINKRLSSASEYPDTILEPEKLQADILALLEE